MNEFVTPEIFKEKFIEVCKEKEVIKSLIDNWEDASKYNSLILGDSRREGILETVANKLELQFDREHWKFDFVMFREKFEEYFKWGNYAKYLDIVIEHENDINDSHKEIHKLNMINAPLKVLITYYKSEEDVGKRLTDYAGIINAGDIFNLYGVKCNLMVIFAPYKKPEKIEWDFHKYHNGVFERLKNV